MHKLLISIKKEIWLLIRDWGGLAILFIMPTILLITITIIQESTFKAVGEGKISILFVDEDKGMIAEEIEKRTQGSQQLELITHFEKQEVNREIAEKLISNGDFQIALIIPKGISENIDIKVQNNVQKILAEFGFENEENQEEIINVNEEKSTQQEFPKLKPIEILFDPAAGESFRSSIKNNMESLIAQVENEKIYKHFQFQMGVEEEGNLFSGSIIEFEETIAQKGNDGIIPNAVQHNVPAWILFGIFFIIVPLSINLVKEKNLGTYVRIKTSPVNYATLLGGKIITYLLISFIQFLLMLGIARFLFPLIGLIPFLPGNQFLDLSIIATFSALCAIGIAILIGTIAKTQEQSAPFGAILTIILAALGGVWVPTFIMPNFMQKISALSPMNWGLNAFYEIILRNGKLWDIGFQLSLLAGFFVLALIVSIFIENQKKRI